MTWFHLILGIYAILTVGPLLTALCIDTPKPNPEPETAQKSQRPHTQAPVLLQSQSGD